MPSDATRTALLDIIQNIDLAACFVSGLAYEAYLDDQLVFYGVTRCLEIISEASRRLPADLKARHPHIPWTEIAGAGNVYRHDYEDVQPRLVWGTVRNRLPALRAVVDQELERLGLERPGAVFHTNANLSCLDRSSPEVPYAQNRAFFRNEAAGPAHRGPNRL